MPGDNTSNTEALQTLVADSTRNATAAAATAAAPTAVPTPAGPSAVLDDDKDAKQKAAENASTKTEKAATPKPKPAATDDDDDTKKKAEKSKKPEKPALQGLVESALRLSAEKIAAGETDQLAEFLVRGSKATVDAIGRVFSKSPKPAAIPVPASSREIDDELENVAGEDDAATQEEQNSTDAGLDRREPTATTTERASSELDVSTLQGLVESATTAPDTTPNP